MAQHTQTPWHIGTDDIPANRTIIMPSPHFAGKRITGATVYGFTEAESAEPNAAFIVKACNMHDELVKACKVLVPLVARGLIEGAFDNIAGGRGYAKRAMEKSEALLAKANE